MKGKMNWELESELALKAVSLGGETTLDRPEKLSVTTKESYRDIVTELDLRVQKQIQSILSASNHPFIGEEGPASELGACIASNKLFWVVDPIDGTTNYVNGISYYAVSVGLCHGLTPLVGAVSLPALKELYFTYGNQGAFLNGKTISGPSSEVYIESALIAGSFSGASSENVKRGRQFQLFGRLNELSRGILRLGSAATNVCYVASGKLQGAYGFDARLWDVAGALAVASQSGCKVFLESTKDGSDRVNYVVGAPKVVQVILDQAKEMELL